VRGAWGTTQGHVLHVRAGRAVVHLVAPPVKRHTHTHTHTHVHTHTHTYTRTHTRACQNGHHRRWSTRRVATSCTRRGSLTPRSRSTAKRWSCTTAMCPSSPTGVSCAVCACVVLRAVRARLCRGGGCAAHWRLPTATTCTSHPTHTAAPRHNAGRRHRAQGCGAL
jgi:hypothetical protein